MDTDIPLGNDSHVLSIGATTLVTDTGKGQVHVISGIPTCRPEDVPMLEIMEQVRNSCRFLQCQFISCLIMCVTPPGMMNIKVTYVYGRFIKSRPQGRNSRSCQGLYYVDYATLTTIADALAPRIAFGKGVISCFGWYSNYLQYLSSLLDYSK